MKLTNKGFVLVETLIVAVFVMGIFSMLYTNYYPLIGEYEKREVYDDIDSKYAAHWARKIILDKKINDTAFSLTDCGGTCKIIYSNPGNINLSQSIFDTASPYFHNYVVSRSIKAVIMTNYNLTTFKNYVNNTSVIYNTTVNDNIFNRGFREYIEYLPKYTTASVNGAGYRVLVVLEHNTSKEYDSYGTIEVRK